MHSIWHDLRYALRQLQRSPAFALTAVLTLALGVGANTAIFSLLDQALLRPLPVRDPQQLVVLEGTGKVWEGHTANHGGGEEAYFSYPMYRDLRDAMRDHRRALQSLIATAPADVGIARNGVSQHGRAELVSGNYFAMLGVQPALGRLLTPNDDEQHAGSLAVLSFDYWKNHLGTDRQIVGSTLSINGHPFQIVGVAAPRFHSAVWGETPDVFAPMAMLDQVVPGKADRLTDRTDRWLNIIGRLKPGTSRAQAQIALAPLWCGLRAEELKALGTRSKHFTAEFLTDSRLRVLPGARGFSYQRDDVRRPLLAVMAMALLVLLMAAVNVASLLLVRAAARMREFSLRYALGAGTRRITQQLLLEGLLIGIAGGVAGIAMAPFTLRTLVSRIAGDQAYVAFTSTIDARLLVFNFAVALGVSVFFSLAPALQLRRPDLTAALRPGSATGGTALLGFRRVMVCLQIGLSLVLLVGAGLFMRTMQKLSTVDVGFNTAHLLTFGINPKLAGYAPAAVPALHQQVLDRLVRLPGVQSVAATDDPELAGNGQGGNITVAGHTDPPEQEFDVEKSYINPGYFSAMQVPLLAGRLFTDGDDASHPHVAVVNASFAKHFCPGIAGCIGRLAANGGGDNVKFDIEIVGVVRDARHEGVRQAVDPTFFQPLKQSANPAILFFYVRTAADPAPMLPVIRRAMAQLDPSLALVALRTMDAQILDDLSNERLVTFLAICFGALATVLAGVGIYGVLAYATAQRTREIGIRIALGSSRGSVARIILADVLRLTGIGIAVSLPVALGLSRLLRSQLFGVSPADPFSLAAAVILVAAVALLAALIPARRAASIDPIEALRTE